MLEEKFVLDPRLALWLPLRYADGIEFHSRDAYVHLCIKIGTTWTPQGMVFDGLDDTIDIPIHSIFQCGAGNPFAVLAWIYLTANQNNQASVYCRSTDTNGAIEFIESPTNRIIFTTTGGVPTGTVTLDLNRLYHVAGIYDGTRAYTYVDGELKSTLTGNPGSGAASLYIGSYDGTTANRYFNGRIYDFKFYRGIFTQQELLEEYIRGKGGLLNEV